MNINHNPTRSQAASAGRKRHIPKDHMTTTYGLSTMQNIKILFQQGCIALLLEVRVKIRSEYANTNIIEFIHCCPLYPACMCLYLQ